MKIIFFTSNLSSGGAQRAMILLANEFSINLHNVTFVVVSCSGAFKNEIAPSVNLICLEKNSATASLLKLTKLIRQIRPDLIISSLNYCNVVLALAHKLSCIKTITIFREDNILFGIKRFKSIKRKFSQFKLLTLMRITYFFASRIVAVSDDVTTSLLNNNIVNKNKISKVYNPVVNIPERTLETKDSDFTHNKKYICSAGRLVEQKGFDLLIRAYAIANIDSDLIIFGTGPLEEKLKNLALSLDISNKVFFPGFINNIRGAIFKSQLFVSSSRWEGFGNVIVEALSVGTPIVAFDSPGGPREILAGGIYGDLVVAEDIQALSSSIIKNVQSRSHSRKFLISRAKEFSSSIIYQYYHDIYLKSLNNEI